MNQHRDNRAELIESLLAIHTELKAVVLQNPLETVKDDDDNSVSLYTNRILSLSQNVGITLLQIDRVDFPATWTYLSDLCDILDGLKEAGYSTWIEDETAYFDFVSPARARYFVDLLRLFWARENTGTLVAEIRSASRDVVKPRSPESFTNRQRCEFAMAHPGQPNKEIAKLYNRRFQADQITTVTLKTSISRHKKSLAEAVTNGDSHHCHHPG